MIVVGVGADDVRECGGPGTDYLMKNVLWGIKDNGFEKQAWSGEQLNWLQFPRPICRKKML